MEIQPSCSTVSLPGAKHSGYLLIAEWLLQLEFRRAAPAVPCSVPGRESTPDLAAPRVPPACPRAQAPAAGPWQHAGLGPPSLPSWMCPCPLFPSGIPPANQRWRAALSLGSY